MPDGVMVDMCFSDIVAVIQQHASIMSKATWALEQIGKCSMAEVVQFARILHILHKSYVRLTSIYWRKDVYLCYLVYCISQA